MKVAIKGVAIGTMLWSCEYWININNIVCCSKLEVFCAIVTGTSGHEHRFCCFGNEVGIGVQFFFWKLKPCFDFILLNKHGVKFVGAPPLDLHWCKAPKEFMFILTCLCFAMNATNRFDLNGKCSIYLLCGMWM